jgi:AraC family transcriptional regulator
MNFRVDKKDAFRIVGVSEPLQKEIEKNFEAVPRMWEKAAIDGTVQKLAGMMDSSPKGILGVCACGDSEDWRYLIAVASTKETGSTLEQYTVPALTWAIFSGAGECPTAIQELEKRIVSEWLPASGYEYDNGPEIEVYLTPDPQNSEFEVWIPITKKV